MEYERPTEIGEGGKEWRKREGEEREGTNKDEQGKEKCLADHRQPN